MPVQHSPPGAYPNVTAGVQQVINNTGHIAATVAQVPVHNLGPSPVPNMTEGSGNNHPGHHHQVIFNIHLGTQLMLLIPQSLTLRRPV